MLKISSGQFRGKKLKTPNHVELRPTSQKVRQAVFNILSNQTNIDQCTVIDLFAGSGALGIEALSLGCQFAYFIEKASTHFNILKENLNSLQLNPSHYQLNNMPAQKWLKKAHNNNELKSRDCLIFLDPPYKSEQYNGALALIKNLKISKNSLVVIESLNQTTLDFKDFEEISAKKYGQTKINILKII